MTGSQGIYPLAPGDDRGRLPALGLLLTASDYMYDGVVLIENSHCRQTLSSMHFLCASRYLPEARRQRSLLPWPDSPGERKIGRRARCRLSARSYPSALCRLSASFVWVDRWISEERMIVVDHVELWLLIRSTDRCERRQWLQCLL